MVEIITTICKAVYLPVSLSSATLPIEQAFPRRTSPGLISLSCPSSLYVILHVEVSKGVSVL